MDNVTAKLTARGKHNGKNVVVECVETRNGDEVRVTVLKNGKADFNAETAFHLCILRMARMDGAGLPEFRLNALFGYWIALHEVYFDAPPEIKITGDFEPFGLPYSDADTSGVVF